MTVFDPSDVLATNTPDAKDTSSDLKDTSADQGLPRSSDRTTANIQTEWATLRVLAHSIRSSGKSSVPQLVNTVLALREERLLTIAELSKLLGREPKGLRRRVITGMLESGLLEWRFPNQPSHEKQAYRSTETGLQQLNRGNDE